MVAAPSHSRAEAWAYVNDTWGSVTDEFEELEGSAQIERDAEAEVARQRGWFELVNEYCRAGHGADWAVDAIRGALAGEPLPADYEQIIEQGRRDRERLARQAAERIARERSVPIEAVLRELGLADADR